MIIVDRWHIRLKISLNVSERGLLQLPLIYIHCTVRHAKNVKFVFFWTISPHCVAVMNIPYESLFSSLQDGAPPVMSFCIIAVLWLHKEDHYQKIFRERTSLVLGVKI